MSIDSSGFKKLLLAGVASAGVGFATADAHAAFIGSTPATNDVTGIREGIFDAALVLIAGGPTLASLPSATRLPATCRISS
jgi:hypothetical protein